MISSQRTEISLVINEIRYGKGMLKLRTIGFNKKEAQTDKKCAKNIRLFLPNILPRYMGDTKHSGSWEDGLRRRAVQPAVQVSCIAHPFVGNIIQTTVTQVAAWSHQLPLA
jgi:hypothetical protein